MKQDAYYELIKYLPVRLKEGLVNLSWDKASMVNEIRLRTNRPIALTCGGQVLFPSRLGLSILPEKVTPKPTSKEMEETVYQLCQGSVYCHQEELCQGYISLPGGHRAGVCGTGVYTDKGLSSVKNFSSICIRVASQIIGCSNSIDMKYIAGGLIIAGPPGSGKTTLLRDIVRRCASGEGGRFYRVAVADERGEISACLGGVNGLDVGLADVICSVEKSLAVMMAVRTMNPQMVVFDEIGNRKDTEAVCLAAASGVDYIATLHSDSIETVLSNPLFRYIRPYTTNIVLLGNVPGEIKRIYNLKENRDEIIGNADIGDFGRHGRNPIGIGTAL